MILPPIKLCPICHSDVFSPHFFPVVWTAEEWAQFYTPGRTPLCPYCAALLIVGDDGELRELTASEICDLTTERLDEIESLQSLIVAAGDEWRVE